MWNISRDTSRLFYEKCKPPPPPATESWELLHKCIPWIKFHFIGRFNSLSLFKLSSSFPCPAADCRPEEVPFRKVVLTTRETTTVRESHHPVTDQWINISDGVFGNSTAKAFIVLLEIPSNCPCTWPNCHQPPPECRPWQHMAELHVNHNVK